MTSGKLLALSGLQFSHLKHKDKKPISQGCHESVCLIADIKHEVESGTSWQIYHFHTGGLGGLGTLS